MKRQPTYNLSRVKQAFDKVSKLNMTFSAMQTQSDLCFSDQDVVGAIQSLSETDFFKSMPPLKEGFCAWQDVYKPTFKGIDLYIKFQIDQRGEIIVSFKEK